MHSSLLMDTWIVSVLNLGGVSDFTMLSTFLYVFFIVRPGKIEYLYIQDTYAKKVCICLQTHRVSGRGHGSDHLWGDWGLKGQKRRELFTVCSCLLFGFLMHYFKK